MPTLRLFVYGTLMRGGCRHHLLADQRFLGPVRTVRRYALYDLGNYPGLVPLEGGAAVVGELYEIDVCLLPRLDREEGVPMLYRRHEVELEGLSMPADAYFYQLNVAGFPRLESGRGGSRRE